MDLVADHVGIVVSDLERSKAFYRALGFTGGDERVMADKTLSFMHLGDLAIELFEYDEPAAAAERPDRALGFKHLALTTHDIDAAVRGVGAGRVSSARTSPFARCPTGGACCSSPTRTAWRSRSSRREPPRRSRLTAGCGAQPVTAPLRERPNTACQKMRQANSNAAPTPMQIAPRIAAPI